MIEENSPATFEISYTSESGYKTTKIICRNDMGMEAETMVDAFLDFLNAIGFTNHHEALKEAWDKLY